MPFRSKKKDQEKQIEKQIEKQKEERYKTIINGMKLNPKENFKKYHTQYIGNLKNIIFQEKLQDQIFYEKYQLNQQINQKYLQQGYQVQQQQLQQPEIYIYYRQQIVEEMKMFFQSKKVPAQPKFYMLNILRDLMELQDIYFVEIFEEQLCKLLFDIANSSDKKQFSNCLNKYYKEKKKDKKQENKKYSSYFHQLLLQCWKHWSELYQDSQIIKQYKDQIIYNIENNDEVYYKNSIIKPKKREVNSQNEIQNQRRNKSLNNRKVSQNKERLLSSERIPNDQQNSFKNSTNQQSQANEVQINSKNVKNNQDQYFQIRKKFFQKINEMKEHEQLDIQFLKIYHYQFQEINEFFYITENQVLKNPEFDEIFRNKFLQDKNQNSKLIKLFNELESGQITQQKFIEDIQQLEQQAAKVTVQSIDDISKNSFQQKSPSFGFSNDQEMMDEKIKESRNGEFEQSEIQFTNSDFQSKSNIQQRKSSKFGEDTQFDEQQQEENFESQQKEQIFQEIQREDKLKQFSKLNNMQTIEEDPLEILESNYSKQITTDLIKSKSSIKKSTSPFVEALDIFQSKPSIKQKQIYKNNSQVFYKKRKLKGKDRRKSTQDKNDSKFDFDFNDEKEIKFKTLKKKFQLKKSQKQLKDKSLEKDFDNFDNDSQNESKIFIQNKKSNQDLDEIFKSGAFNSNIKLSSTKFQTKKEQNESNKKQTLNDNTFTQDPFEDFNEEKDDNFSVPDSDKSEIDIKEQKQIQRVTRVSSLRRQSNSNQKIALDKQAFDSSKFNAPQFEQEQNVQQENQKPLLSPRKNQYKNSLFKTKGTINPQNSDIIMVKKKDCFNQNQGEGSLIQDNLNIEETEQYQNLKIKNQYLQQQCDSLFEKLMSQQDIIKKQEGKQSDEDDQIVEQIQQQQNLRKLNFLEQENKSLKKEIDNVFKEKNKIEQKKEEENKLLKQLTNQLEKLNEQFKTDLQKEQKKNKKLQSKCVLQEQLIDQLSKALDISKRDLKNSNLIQQKNINIERSGVENQSLNKENKNYISNSQNEFIADHKLTYDFDQISEYPSKQQDSFCHNLDTRKASLHFKQNFQEQPTIIEKPLQKFDYENQQKLEYFEKDINTTFIRACSVFEKSILFENEYLQILCNTNKIFNRAQKEIFLTLSYIPKQTNLRITTHLITCENITLNPNLIVSENIINLIRQEFSYKTYTDYKLIQFPLLEVIIDISSNRYQYTIPLPFTLNKFISFQQLDEEKLSYQINQMKEIYNENVVLNEEILENWTELKSIFENLYFINDTKFYSFVNFGANKRCIFELEIMNEKVLMLKCFALKEDKMYQNFLDWFCWIFAENNFNQFNNQMGNQIIITKQATEFDDLVNIKKNMMDKLGFKTKNKEGQKRHISAWRIYGQTQKQSIEAVNLYSATKVKNFELQKQETYIILLIEKIKQDNDIQEQDFKFPNSLENLLDSFDNMTQRGLSVPFTQNLTVNDLSYKIFLLNGKQASNQTKAQGVVKTMKLEKWIIETKFNGLYFLYYGFYFRKGKLKNGNRLELYSSQNYSGKGLNVMKVSQCFVAQLLGYNPIYQNTDDYQKQIKEIFFSDLNVKQSQKIFTERRKQIRQKNFLKDQSLQHIKQENSQSSDFFESPKKLRTLQTKDITEKSKRPTFNLNLKNLNLPQGNYKDKEMMGETSRKIKKMEKYENQCSEIWNDKIYVSGYKVAQNSSLLKQTGITHVLNLAGDYCTNNLNDQFTYETYYIKDSKKENIECIFYECFEFILEAIKKQGKILIHCVYGVSRSITITIAFLIFNQKMNFQDAFDLARSKRGVASPNIGFIAQLMLFEKRIYHKLEERYYPLVYVIGSHQIEDSKRIVCRHLYEYQFYKQDNYKKDFQKFDPRSVFLIVSHHQSYLWVGKQIIEECKNIYLERVNEYFQILINKEKINKKFEVIHQGEETNNFWQIFNFDPEKYTSNNLYEINTVWNKWFINPFEQSTLRSRRSPKSRLGYAERDQIKQRPTLFIYPFYLEPLYELDFDDLRDNSFALLCDFFNNKFFTWKGKEFITPKKQQSLTSQNFIKFSIENLLDCSQNIKKLNIQKNYQDIESKNFMSYFQIIDTFKLINNVCCPKIFKIVVQKVKTNLLKLATKFNYIKLLVMKKTFQLPSIQQKFAKKQLIVLNVINLQNIQEKNFKINKKNGEK